MANIAIINRDGSAKQRYKDFKKGIVTKPPTSEPNPIPFGESLIEELAMRLAKDFHDAKENNSAGCALKEPCG